jgi:hypothetical protein
MTQPDVTVSLMEPLSMHLPFALLLAGRMLFVSYFIAMGMSHLIHFGDHSLLLKRKASLFPEPPPS